MVVGKKLTMSFVDYKVQQLWQSFIPKRKEIKNVIGNELISATVYKPNHFEDFKPTNEFEKWAGVIVSKQEDVPDEMDVLVIKDGLYAVFDYTGLSTDDSIYKYIHSEWLPNSEYSLDNRVHFEVLGDKYKNYDPTSEEEIWIPIKTKLC